MKRKTSPHRIIFCFGQFWVSQQLLCQQIFSEVFRFSVNSRSPHSLWYYVRCSGNSRAADNYCSIKCSQWTISTGWFSELIQERFMNPCSIIQTCRQTRKRSPTLPKNFRSKYVFFCGGFKLRPSHQPVHKLWRKFGSPMHCNVPIQQWISFIQGIF